MKSRSKQDCLEHFLEAISSKTLDAQAVNELQKEGLTHPDFEARYIIDQLLGDFHLTSELLSESTKAIFDLKEVPGGMPYRLVMLLEGHWQIRSFEFWCVGCFGEDTECGVCGGSGWGVL